MAGVQVSSYDYDANGNGILQSRASGLITYTWDEENRLTGVAFDDGTISTYVYSADGLRQRKEDSGGVVNYLWDEGRVLQELDASLVEIVRYTQVGSQSATDWDSLVSQHRGGVGSYYAYDLNGNTRTLVDETGAVTDTYVYEAFGLERDVTGSTANVFRFGGQWGYQRDELTRLYVRARHLDTARAKWFSRDPIGFDGGDSNLYRYVGNNPVGGVDPSGLKPKVPKWILSGQLKFDGCTENFVNSYFCVLDEDGKFVGNPGNTTRNIDAIAFGNGAIRRCCTNQPGNAMRRVQGSSIDLQAVSSL